MDHKNKEIYGTKIDVIKTFKNVSKLNHLRSYVKNERNRLNSFGKIVWTKLNRK